MLLYQIKPKQIERFCAAIRERLFTEPVLAKQYLQTLVTEIRVNTDSAKMKGRYIKLLTRSQK